MNFVAIDFETANRYRTSACSIAAVTVENGKISKSAYSLIRPPELKFDYWNTRIHGIKAEDVADKPTFAELWEKIRPHLEDKIVIAHNAAFDMSVLRSVIKAYDLPVPRFHHVCTVDVAKRVWPDQSSYRLSALADNFGVSFAHHHALHDAKVCAFLAIKAAENLQVANFNELLHALNMKLKEF